MREPILKIKPVFVDGFGHGRSDQQIDPQSLPHPFPDLRGGNPQREPAQLAAAEGIGERLFRCAGARDDDKLGALSQFLGIAPFGQEGVDRVLRVSCQGETEEAQPFPGRREGGVGLERGLGGGDEAEAVQREFFESRLGHEQVPEVNWVEGTAVEPDLFHGRRLTRRRE